MKKLLLSIIVAPVVLAAFAVFDMTQPSAAAAIALPSVIQKGGGLSLSQIEDLIKNGTPDSTIAIEIKNRGISSPLNACVLSQLERILFFTSQKYKGAYPIITERLTARSYKRLIPVAPCLLVPAETPSYT